MPCPFLTRLSANNVQNLAPALLKLYGSQCPVFSKLLLTTGNPEALAESNENDPQNIKSDSTFPYEECFQKQIDAKKQDHTYRVFKKIDRLADPGLVPKAVENTSGELVTVWCSNDYLGMSSDKEVVAAAGEALQKYGSSAGGTRNIAGNSTLHESLEKTLAKLHGKEAALLFTSCYVANDSTLYTLAKALPGCHIFSDIGNHASIIRGILNSNVAKHKYRHNNVEHLEMQLKIFPKDVPKIVAFETVHSMDGSICPLKELCEVSHKYGALTFVDEVHAVGLYGEHGGGIGERDGLMENMDIISATLGKAFGNIGGYVASSALIIDVIRSYSSGFIFTTSLPPHVLAGAQKAINILSSEKGRQLRRKQQENVQYLRQALMKSGFPVETTESHIIPIKVGNPWKCTMISDNLLKYKHHYVQAINYPTVPFGQEKLRLSPTPYHTKEAMDLLVESLSEIWINCGLSMIPSKHQKSVCKICQNDNCFENICRRDNCPFLI